MSTAIIGGISFVAGEELFEADDGFSDLTVTAEWVDPVSRPSGVPLAAPGELHLWLERNERRISLPALDGGTAVRSWQLRQAAPVVAACFDRLTLHASAVILTGGSVAFVAESDAGKSTLAWELVKAGADPISDDLLPVRFADTVTVPPSTPLTRICFLSRQADQMRLSRLAASDAMQRHLANGFGEHGDSSAWAFQFDAYHQLIESVPHFDLVIPDDRSSLSDVIDWLPTALETA